MAKVVGEQTALTDLNAIAAYIRQFDSAAAERYTVAVRDLGKSLVDFPRRGRPAGMMRELTSVPPYILGYRVIAAKLVEEVRILSIRHGRQHPRD